jgi:hypothetical protein
MNDSSLTVLMLIHVVVWGFLWATTGNSGYAALFGFSLASFIFMAAWTKIDRVKRDNRT